jgi:hypothetical protein
MKSILFVILIVFAASVSHSPAQPEAPSAVELKLLEPLTGNWRFDFTIYKSEWTPEEKHGTGASISQWIVGKRVVEDKGSESDGTSYLKLYTYDTKTSSYHAWWFSSTGNFNDATGRWDAEKQTFLWTTLLPSGITGTTSQHFVDDKHLEWDVIFKDAGGRVYFHSGGKSLRQ